MKPSFIHRAGLFGAACCLGLTALHGQNITDVRANAFPVSWVGAIGDAVTIFGSGFAPGNNPNAITAVRFNGTGAAYSVQSDTQINVTGIPVGATAGLVSVVRSNVTTAFSAQVFQIVPGGPYIVSFSPTNGSGGTPVTISGVRLSNVSTTNNVLFNGQRAGTVTSTSFNVVSCTAPPGVTTGPITVTATGGTIGTNTTSANFFAPSAITGFSPAFGRSGTNVVIRGSNFVGATSVLFNGLAASFVINSNAQITATVPANATTGPLIITVPGGSSQTTSNFVVQPTLISFNPNVGAAGTNVILTGANLNEGTSAVRFGTNAAAFVVNNAAQITATVPAGAVTSFISVTTTNGSHTNLTLFYLRPRITTFSSSNAPVGNTVTINGTNFLGATAVAFNGVPAAFLNVSNFSLQAVVPAGFVTGPVTITTPAGTTNSPGLFYAAPLITGFAPVHGLPGTNVLITGSSLTNASAVTFGGVPALTLQVLSNSGVRALVPTGALSGVITVTTPGGLATSAGTFLLDTDIPVPDLRATLNSNSQIQLAWPTNLIPFTLEGTTNLADAFAWANVTNAPVPVGNSNVVTEPADGDGKFYRLKK